MATPAAYGRFKARGWIGAAAACLQHQIQATSAVYTTAQGNARSLTHWARPGIEPTSSWIQVKFVTHRATTGTWVPYFLSTEEVKQRERRGRKLEGFVNTVTFINKIIFGLIERIDNVWSN